MLYAHRSRSSSIGLGLAVAGVAVVYCAVVAGCDNGQGAPPNTAQAQGAESAMADDGGAGGGHHRHMPPPAAFDACKGKAVGDVCTAEIHDSEINGKCEAAPPGAPQSGPACRPEGGARHKEHRGPPPEIVFAACDGKTAGDACSVAFERGTLQGACMMPRHADAGAERMLCAPAHPHGHGAGAGGPGSGTGTGEGK